jgi:hypothetical protein
MGTMSRGVEGLFLPMVFEDDIAISVRRGKTDGECAKHVWNFLGAFSGVSHEGNLSGAWEALGVSLEYGALFIDEHLVQLVADLRCFGHGFAGLGLGQEQGNGTYAWDWHLEVLDRACIEHLLVGESAAAFELCGEPGVDWLLCCTHVDFVIHATGRHSVHNGCLVVGETYGRARDFDLWNPPQGSGRRSGDRATRLVDLAWDWRVAIDHELLYANRTHAAVSPGLAQAWLRPLMYIHTRLSSGAIDVLSRWIIDGQAD